MGCVILCSGQGAQSREMFALVADEPAAQSILAAARTFLDGRDPRDFVAGASELELHGNRVAQLLCATQALAAWNVVKDAISLPVTFAGYSAGELPAWSLAGAMDATTTLDLVDRRSQLMDRAAPAESGLAAVLGLRRAAIDELCLAHDLHIAIVNADDHVLLGGMKDDLRAALDEALSRGAARAKLLPIGVASHTPLLAAACEPFEAILQERLAGNTLADGHRLLSGIDGGPVRVVPDGLHKLALQIRQTVDWAACMATAQASNPHCVLELGPGDGLARMFGEVAPDLPVRSVTAFRSAGGVRDWLASLSR